MNFRLRHNWKQICTATAMAAGVTFATLAPQPASASSLAGLFASLSVNEGCAAFPGPYGNPVPVQYYVPKNACNAPAILIVHGSDGLSRYAEHYREVGLGLAAKGYAAFVVHYYEGAPGAQRPTPADRELPDPGAFYPWADTVRGGINFVEEFPGVDGRRIGLLGMSLGGFLSSSVSTTDDRVKALAVLSGGIPEEFAKDAANLPPTLIVHGDQDPDVPVSKAMDFHHLLRSKGVAHRLHILPCEGHLPYRVYKKNVADTVLCFFDTHL